MDEREDVLGRAIETMRELPEVGGESTARILIAVAAQRQRQREGKLSRFAVDRRWLAWGGLASAAALVGALLLLPNARRSDSTPVVASTRVVHSPPTAVPVSRNGDMENSMRPVQLVFSAPGARSVRVVGDFNGWDDRQAPMVRDDASGLWSVSLMLRPGRHVYAFVVNDTQWVRDPRTAPAPDADFGRPGSVLLVGRP